MRDDQVRRYARHILLPDLGGLGQTALLGSAARIDLRDDDPGALIAAIYLAAGGVGTIVPRGATPAQLARLRTYGPDTKLDTTDAAEARDVPLPARRPWWPSAEGDELALAFWRGGLAATRWMAEVATR